MDFSNNSNSDRKTSIDFSSGSRYEKARTQGPTFRDPATRRMAEAMSPTEFALARTWGDILEDVVPYSRFASKQFRYDFPRLPQADQHKILLWEAFNLSLVEAGGTALGYGLKSLFGKAAPLLKGKNIFMPKPQIKSVGDILQTKKFKPFVATKAKYGKLRSMGFETDEAFSILARSDLHKFERQKLLGGVTPSKAWSKNIEIVAGPKGSMYKRPNQHTADMIDTKTLLNRHRLRVFSNTVKGIVPGTPTKNLIHAAHKEQLSRFGFKTSTPMDFGNLTEVSFYNMVDDMVEYPTNIKAMSNVSPGRIWPTRFTPQRVVAGLSEGVYKTWSKVHVPIKNGYEAKNLYVSAQVENLFGIFEKNGLGKLAKKRKGKAQTFEYHKAVTKDVEEQAFKGLRQLDELFGNLSQTPRNDLTYQIAQKEADALVKRLKVKSPVVHRLITSWHEMSDLLYTQDLFFSTSKVFNDIGLAPKGQKAVEALMARWEPIVNKALTGHNSTASKLITIDSFLLNAKKVVGQHTAGKTKVFTDRFTKAMNERTMRGLTRAEPNGTGTLTDYFDNYFPRQGKDGAEDINQLLITMFDNKAGYTMERLNAYGAEPLKTLNDTMLSRIYSQGNKMFFFEGINDTKNTLLRLPKKHQEFYGHWLARMRGLPSGLDHTMADWMTNAMSNTWLARMKKNPDARSIQKAGMFLNDLAFMGGLGLKPFSAARNLFQPFINVPGDLGGVRSLKNLANGMLKLIDPRKTQRTLFDAAGHVKTAQTTMKSYLDEVGIIAEYLPEQVRGHRILNPHGMAKYMNMDNVRETTLWMFQKSDRTNRYITGAAAADRWDSAFKQYGHFVNAGKPKKFLNRLGSQNRYPWIQKTIEGKLAQGAEGIEQAKRVFIKDVVADTQYLYGLADSPMIASDLGALGRTGGIFASWGMNYSTLLLKGVKTGKVSQNLKNLTGFILGGMVVGEAMNYIWGPKTAKRSVLTGAVTRMPQYLPPAWGLFYHPVDAIYNNLSQGDTAKAKQSMDRWINGMSIWAPGGVQINKSIKGHSENAGEGLARSLFGMEPEPREYKPGEWIPFVGED